MKSRSLLALFCLALAFAAWPINPMDHTSLLDKHDKDKSGKQAPAEDPDMESPYFILTGEAEQAIKAEDYNTAALRLQEALLCEPDNPANALLLSNLGMVYNFLDRDSLALDSYDKALEIAPSMSTVRNNRALLNLKMGRDTEAVSDFAKVIERDSLNLTARFYHGIILLYAGDLDSATKDFQVLSAEAPDDFNTWVSMASLYFLTGEDAKAIPYFKLLAEAEPSAEYYSALAGCYLAVGNLSEASATIAEGLKQWPRDPELYYYRAWLNRDSFLMDAAHADAKTAISLGASPAKVNALFK